MQNALQSCLLSVSISAWHQQWQELAGTCRLFTSKRTMGLATCLIDTVGCKLLLRGASHGQQAFAGSRETVNPIHTDGQTLVGRQALRLLPLLHANACELLYYVAQCNPSMAHRGCRSDRIDCNAV